MTARDNPVHGPIPRRRLLAAAGAATASCAAAGLMLTTRGAGATGASRRPFSDFLVTQGTYCLDDGGGGCLLFVPPAPNFFGWNTRPDAAGHVLFSGVDYAGLANTFFQNAFHTVVEGSVFETPLPDGRAEVRVLANTRNANTWVIDLDLNGDVLGQIKAAPTLFGSRPGDGGGYALGRAMFDARFINTAPGAPLPDLLRFNFGAQEPGQVLEFLAFTGEATGPLGPAFGAPAGAVGRCNQVQRGLLATALRANANSRVGFDAFPAENIRLQRIR
jgi:hypothetical protein